MAREALNWRYDDLHEGLFHDGTLTRWSDKRSVDFPNAARDGVTLWVAQMDLDPKRSWLSKPPLAVQQASEDVQDRDGDENA